jgi:probable rRNA maturation factor
MRRHGPKKLRKKSFFLKKFVIFFQENIEFPNKKITLSLLLSNNKCIKKLNKNFRNKNKSTDILSFPLAKKTMISKKTYIGDIIISYNFMNKPKTQNIKNFKKKSN